VKRKKNYYPLTFNVNGYRQILHNGISLAINSSVARFTNVLSTILHLDVGELNYAFSFSLLRKKTEQNIQSSICKDLISKDH